MKKLLFIALALTMLQGVASAQAFRRTPTPNDTLKSVRVLPNGNTLFSIYAPKARTVSVTGDAVMGPVKTTERNGVWTMEVPGIKAGAYRYSFIVDGIQVFDPKFSRLGEQRPVVKLDMDQDMFWAQKDVPHGAMAQIFYKSSTTGTTRRAHVWTPAAYNASKDKLPVFYLIHGGGDNDASWPGIGCAGDILDNLLAEGKMVPMVVVMPDGSIDVQSFVKDFANDLKPYIEKNYRVKLGSAYTALAGLSQGRLAVTETIQAHPGFFAYVNVMSSGWFVNNPQMYEDGEKALAAAAPTLKKTLKYLKFTVGGEEDGAYPNCHGMMKVYDKLGIKYDYSD
ncbi:MAG: endo-1,4-beta-xylanase Z, partial [Bacteroidales bacterium]|nr:endo-1,4-beta-xylanase Z [Bacteroidales bacterium]